MEYDETAVVHVAVCLIDGSPQKVKKLSQLLILQFIYSDIPNYFPDHMTTCRPRHNNIIIYYYYYN